MNPEITHFDDAWIFSIVKSQHQKPASWYFRRARCDDEIWVLRYGSAGLIVQIGKAMLPILLSGLLILQPAATKTYQSKPHNLQLDIPAAWKVQPTRNGTNLIVSGTKSPARVELYVTNYQGTSDDWQNLRKQVNSDMNRKIDRQWEEILLGVPLLMIRVNYNDPKEGGDISMLDGLLFANTSRKFQFRLFAKPDEIAGVEEQWRNSMTTLRTMEGNLPEKEDGLSNAPASEPIARPGESIRLQPRKNSDVKLGPVSAAFTVSGRSGEMRLPQGWNVAGEAERRTLSHKDFPGEIKVLISSILDSPVPSAAILDEARRGADRFKTVASRENFGPIVNKAKTPYWLTVRKGRTETEDLVQMISVVDIKDFYWTLTFESTDLKSSKATRKKFEALLNAMGAPQPK
jgi:hypothetical protein